TITTTNGAALIVSGGTLDGVTVNGVLDIGNTSSNGVSLMVTNGLVLNGTALLGNPTNGLPNSFKWWGEIRFAGSQTLSGTGTVVFGNATYTPSSTTYFIDALRIRDASTTLTIGPGLTVRGLNGTVGNLYLGGPPDVSIINQGTISADVAGGNIVVVAQPFSNSGLLRSEAGTLTLVSAIQRLGTIDTAGGVVQLSGLLDNSGFNLLLDGSSNALRLAGGTIRGGTITTTNGAALIVSGGTLDGVTVNGVLDIGNTSSNGVSLMVTNGLVLNGTALLGNPTNGLPNSFKWWGEISFAGSQTLSGTGTVVFGNATYTPSSTTYFIDALRIRDASTTLTIGPGLTVRGLNGTVGNLYLGGPPDVSIINQGTISADVAGGNIVVVAQPFSNSGLLRSEAGTLTLVSAIQRLGTIDTAGGVVQLSGLLDNSGFNLLLDGSSNALRLAGGTIRGGTITTTNGAALIVSGGTLDGVTVNGVLDIGNTSSNGVSLMVTNGLVLNGTALLGNPTNGLPNSFKWWGEISFAGSQTLSGTGTVVFGNATYTPSSTTYFIDALRIRDASTTLTIGPGLTVRGLNGTVGNLYLGGPPDVSIINQGTISADVAGGNIVVVAQPFSNSGLLRSEAGTLTLVSAIQRLGTIDTAGGVVQLSGLLDNSGFNLLLDGSSNALRLAGGTIRGGTITTTNGA